MKKLFAIFGLAVAAIIAIAAYPYVQMTDGKILVTDGKIRFALIPDLLDEDCADISDWVDDDEGTAVSEVSPAGQFRFDTNLGAAENAKAVRTRVITSPPDKFTIKIKTYFDALGTVANNDRMLFYGSSTTTWQFLVNFASDGLFVYKTEGATTEVGADIVKCNVGAAWQIWRFQIDKSGGEDAATVEVFLDGVSQGTFDCDHETMPVVGQIQIRQLGYFTDNIVSHIDYLKIATGLGTI